MSAATPHFLLFSEAQYNRCEAAREAGRRRGGRWRFVLESIDGIEKLEAADEEPDLCGDRLHLLAVVRGLEALDQPSRVTLVTSSHYVSRGLRNGLAQWRENGWQWERFGKMTPIKNRDLWRRVDRAMKYHQVECRTWRFDLPHDTPAAPASVRRRRVESERKDVAAGRVGLRSRPGWVQRGGDAACGLLSQLIVALAPRSTARVACSAD